MHSVRRLVPGYLNHIKQATETNPKGRAGRITPEMIKRYPFSEILTLADKDDVLFLLISLHNGSSVSYGLSNPRFSVESKRRTKRGLQYEKAVFPRQSYGLGVTAPDATGKMVFTFDKVSLTRGQVFRIYFYERGGARNYVITLSPADINRAKRLN